MSEVKKVSNSYLIVLLVLLVSTVCLRLWQIHWPEEWVRVNDIKLRVLVAQTKSKWEKGLNGRAAWNNYDGMLFLYPDAVQRGVTFTDLRLPVDYIWLNYGEIVDLAANLSASSANNVYFYPRKDANMVLVLPAGSVDKYNLKIGDKLSVD